MSIPKPPFHSVADELLYNIYLKIMNGEGTGGLTASDIDTIAKLNAIITDGDLMKSEEILNVILSVKGNVPDSGNTLEKLYNLITGLNYLSQQDIDTIAELNAIINDADVARTADIEALLDNAPAQGNSLKKLYDLILSIAGDLNTTSSPPSLFCDFDVVVVNLSLGSYNIGGGIGGSPGFSFFGVDNDQNCFGVLKLSTAASTAGGAYLSSVYHNIVLGIGYKINVSGRLAIETLSDDANNFSVYFGLGGPIVTNPNPVDGVFFKYNHLVNGGRWEAICRQGGIETAVNTGFVADITTYHTFLIRSNAEGTSVDFFIGDMNIPVATIVDNIPNGNTQGLALFGKIEKTAGATARNLYFDYVKYVPLRSAPR